MNFPLKIKDIDKTKQKPQFLAFPKYVPAPGRSGLKGWVAKGMK